MDSVSSADWKEEVGDSVSGYSSLLEEAGNAHLHKEIERVKLKNVLQNLKIARQ